MVLKYSSWIFFYFYAIKIPPAALTYWTDEKSSVQIRETGTKKQIKQTKFLDCITSITPAWFPVTDKAIFKKTLKN